MRGLSDALEKHKVAIRADFQQFYNGLDIADVWRGTLHKRRALELLEGLAHEPHSRYRAEALGEGYEFHEWDRHAQMLADIFDALQSLTYVTVKVQGGKPKQPAEYPRPQMADLGPEDVVMPPIEELTIDNFPIQAVMALTAMK